MRLLKQSTGVTLNLGPMVDASGSAKTALTLTPSDILLSKNGGIMAAKADAATATADTAGYYRYDLTASDVNTLGRLRVACHPAGVLHAWDDYMVVPANVYNSLVGGSDYLNARVADISGTPTAVANLKAQYDGTGLSGDVYPSTQSQLAGIANVGSASHREFTGEDLTTPATTTGGSHTDTKALDEIYMYWDSVSGGFEAELTGNIGAGSPSGIKITGYMNGANDKLFVQMWDYQAGTPAWVTLGAWSGGGSSANQVLPFDAFIGMVGTGANLGNVRLRLYNDNGGDLAALTNANIYIDQVFIEFSENTGASLDAVYFDSNASNTGTTSVDGTPGNPVSTEAAVNTLLADRNLNKVIVALESSITFATSHINEDWEGKHWTAELEDQDFSGSHLEGADVSGVGTGTARIDFKNCTINTATIHQFHMENCGFNGTLTLGETGSYVIYRGHSAIAGATTPVIDTGAALANVDLSMPGWLNGVEIRNLNATGTDLFSISGIGQIIYAASSSGAVNQRGDWKVTNTGGVAITPDDNTANAASILNDTSSAGVVVAASSKNDYRLSATGVNDILDASSSGSCVGSPTTLRKLMHFSEQVVKNKLEYIKGTDTMTMYEDDSSTPKWAHAMTDDATEATRGKGA